jgi:hypothetical protein
MVLTGMQGMRRAVFDGQSAKNKAANEVVRGGARLGQIATWKPKRHHLLTRHDDGFGGYCDSHLATHLRPDLQASLSLCQARKGQHHSEVVPSGYLPRSKETSSGATFDLTGATTRLIRATWSVVSRHNNRMMLIPRSPPPQTSAERTPTSPPAHKQERRRPDPRAQHKGARSGRGFCSEWVSCSWAGVSRCLHSGRYGPCAGFGRDADLPAIVELARLILYGSL